MLFQIYFIILQSKLIVNKFSASRNSCALINSHSYPTPLDTVNFAIPSFPAVAIINVMNVHAILRADGPELHACTPPEAHGTP